MKNICVFCGSSAGKNPLYREAAKKLGEALVNHKQRLIYGGGNIGLMGTIAEEVMSRGGEVIGVIPAFLMDKEVGNVDVTELIVVESMHERKHKMAHLADAFIAMPGGFGTLEELAEVLTWVQLELIKKPVGVLNLNGYYDLLISQLNHMVGEGFLRPQNRKLLIEIEKVEDALDTLHSFSFGDYSIWDKLDRT